MDDKRYSDLMNEKVELTLEEFQLGWHFCYEFDGLLRNNNEEGEHGFQCDCIKFIYWCNSHQRQCEKTGCNGYKEGYVTGPEKYKGEILLPCLVVNLTGIAAIEKV